MSRFCGPRMAAAVFLAMAVTISPAQAAVEKFFVGGNHSSCRSVFDALEAQHPAFFPAGTFGTVNAEILVEPLADSPPTYVDSIGADGFLQQVDISNSGSVTKFDWTEVPPVGGGALRGFDAISIKAGNGRTVYVYTPDGTGGNNLSDLNTTQRISSVRLCADDQVTIVEGGELCDLDSSDLADACNAAGETTVVQIFEPGSGDFQLCPCPGVIFNICNPLDVCNPDDHPAGFCSTEFPAGFCDPDDPNDTSTVVTETACCAQSPAGNPLEFSGEIFGFTGVPTANTHEFICSNGKTYPAGKEPTSVTMCFPIAH